MKNLEGLEIELAEFTPERFNDHYRNLIDIAIPSSREYELLHTLNFISTCQMAIDKVKKALEKLPDETPENQPGENHCPMCEAKEKTIQTAEKLIEQAEQRLKSKDDTIKTLQELKDEAMKALNSFTGKHLKVCKKEHFPSSERTLMGDFKPDAY